MSDPRDRLAARLGVLETFLDTTGRRQHLGAETRDAMLAAMDAPTDPLAAARHLDMLDAADAARPLPRWLVLDADAAHRLEALDGQGWTLALEDGETRKGQGAELGALPVGIHDLNGAGWVTTLLVAPRQVPLPPRGWGVTLPLYGLGQDGAVGSYADLAAAVAALGKAGADFVGINPVHAGFPADPQAFSPYSPSHRGRLSVAHIAPERAIDALGGELLDWPADQGARRTALRAEFDAGAPGFADWRAAEGEALQLFALHQALSDTLGPYWTDWPAPYRDPNSAEVASFAAENTDTIAFHAWLQWRAERDLTTVHKAADAAGMRFGLYVDLAVGTQPMGAETWADPTLFASGVSLGAPPDAFSSKGQSWGLAPLRPDTLADRGFRPLATILRQQLRHARLMRIDHILGFERAFWVPQDRSTPGAYVAMPRDALLAVARIEAARVGATIVGEDLGNIPDGLQSALHEAGILGCRVAQFQQDWNADTATFLPADTYPESAMTSFGTHDLPTWEGWKHGRDIDWRRDIGDIDDAAHAEAHAKRRDEVAALTGLLGGDDAAALHRFLAETPSRLVAVQIEDLLGRVEQPNLPGTVHEHPNWRRPLGVAPDALGNLDAVAETTRLMLKANRRGRDPWRS